MSLSDLRKFSTTIIKDKSASDQAQIPATVDVDVYKRGATVSAATIVAASGGTATISLYALGSLNVTSTLQVGSNSSANLTVTAVASETSITVRNDGADDVALALNSRLVMTSSRPTLYVDTTGTAVLDAAGHTTTDARGYVEFYLTDRVFDYIVTSGSNVVLFTDQESGQRYRRPNHYNIMDFPGYAPQTGHNGVVSAQVDVAAALAAIPAGRRLYFPQEEGPFIPPSTAGWTISKPIEIFSDGRAGDEAKCFQPYQESKDGRVFDISSAMVKDFYLHDAVFSTVNGMPATDGLGDYVHYSGNSTISGVIIERCFFFYAGRSAIWLEGNSPVVFFVVRDCTMLGCGGHGMYINGGAAIDMTGSICISNGGMGAVFVNAGNGVHIKASSFEFNGSRLTTGSTATLPQMFGSTYNGQLMFVTSDGMVSGCNFEGLTENTTWCLNAITLNGCHGMVLGGNEIDTALVGGLGTANIVGIKIVNGSKGNTILSNEFTYIDKIVECDSAANDYGNVIMPQSVLAADANAPGRVVVPANSRNWVYVQDRTNATGFANDKGVGLILPNLPTAATATTVSTTDAGSTVQAAAFEGMLVYNSADNRVQVLTSANTFASLT